jgi:hypothetical protein
MLILNMNVNMNMTMNMQAPDRPLRPEGAQAERLDVVQDHGICHWRLDVPVLFITLFFLPPASRSSVPALRMCELPCAVRITAHTHRTRTRIKRNITWKELVYQFGVTRDIRSCCH